MVHAPQMLLTLAHLPPSQNEPPLPRASLQFCYEIAIQFHSIYTVFTEHQH